MGGVWGLGCGLVWGTGVGEGFRDRPPLTLPGKREGEPFFFEGDFLFLIKDVLDV